MNDKTQKKPANPIVVVGLLVAVGIVGLALYNRLAPSKDARQLQESADKIDKALEGLP